MTLPGFTRRDLARLLLRGVASTVATEVARAAPTDQGIGGTGAAPEPEQQGGGSAPSDRGIGGTGVVGTIRKFGSIYVNDLRIAYPSDVTVHIDGAPATASDLRVGQVVRVVAQGSGTAYSTTAIEVSSEVAGPIEKTSGQTMVVAGQTVALDQTAHSDWKAGDFVAVYGLRRPDATIVASLVTPRRAGPIHLAGPVRANPSGGAPMIGGLVIVGADPALIGSRAVVTGRLHGENLIVRTQVEEQQLLARSGARSFVIEAYAQRQDGAVRLGSGLLVAGAAAGLAAGGAVLAIIHADLNSRGQFGIRSFRAIRGFEGPGGGGPGGGRGPGGRGPGGGGRRGPPERRQNFFQRRFGRLFGGQRPGGLFGGRRPRAPLEGGGFGGGNGLGTSPGPGGGGLGGLGGGGLGGVNPFRR